MDKVKREYFLDNFETLPKTQKNIWRYLQKCSKKNKDVSQNHQVIAKACGCHRSTVVRVTNRFEELEWLIISKRAYGTNVYCIKEDLLSINTFRK